MGTNGNTLADAAERRARWWRKGYIVGCAQGRLPATGGFATSA
jgi:hypothetical protein